LIGSATGDRHSAVIFLDGVGHYQQPISANGSLSAGHDHWPLSAMVGVRDHSWGRRVWSSLYRDRSLWIAFDHDLTFICCKTWLSPEAPPDVMGCVVKGGTVTPLRKIDLESRFRPGTHYHDSVQLELEDADRRRYLLTGKVISYVPLRHRSPVAETVFLGQAMTRFKFEDRESLGLSEYFDAASACHTLVELSRHGATVRE
jgi:hypothetical protein